MNTQKEASASATIIVNDDICQSEEELHRFLEPYYLGASAEYTLVFSAQYAPSVDRVFDSLIQKNGLRSVFFHFHRHSTRKTS